MTETTETEAERHSLRVGIFMVVVTVAQLFDRLLDLRIDRFTTEDGRAFRDLANLAAGSASVVFVVLLVVLVVLAMILIRERRPFTRELTPHRVLATMAQTSLSLIVLVVLIARIIRGI